MAERWTKVREGLVKHSKVLAVSVSLRAQRQYVLGVLIELWQWAQAEIEKDNGQRQGDDAIVFVHGDPKSLIDSLTGVSGLADSLISVGWLRTPDGRLEFPNFFRHNGSESNRRAEDQARKSRVRKVSASCPQSVRTPSAKSLSPPTPPPIPESKYKMQGERTLPLPPLAASFWDAYPQHRRDLSKRKLGELWQRRGLDAKAEQIMASLAAWNRSDQWQTPRFVRTMSAWLNNDGWENLPAASTGPSQPLLPKYETDNERSMRLIRERAGAKP